MSHSVVFDLVLLLAFVELVYSQNIQITNDASTQEWYLTFTIQNTDGPCDFFNNLNSNNVQVWHRNAWQTGEPVIVGESNGNRYSWSSGGSKFLLPISVRILTTNHPEGIEFTNIITNFNTNPVAIFDTGRSFCTQQPTNAPVAAPELENMMCSRIGSCQCPQGIHGCMIHCYGTSDACKDGIIECNPNGGDCIVNCMAENACSGTTTINGPVGGSLTVNCIGQKSCKGNVKFNGELGKDLTVICEGSEACKGNAEFSFGTGRAVIACTGHPHSCQGSVFKNNFNSMSVQCTGQHCPPY